MKYSLGPSNFLEESSSRSPSIVFLYFFALITEEGFLISPCYSLQLGIQMWSHGPQPCLTQWNYEPCQIGPPKTDGSRWRVLTKCGPVEKGMGNHFSILALRTQCTVWKGKKIGHGKMNSQVPNMLLKISGEITPDRMNRWSQSKKNTELRMWPVMEVKSDATKTNIT